MTGVKPTDLAARILEEIRDELRALRGDLRELAEGPRWVIDPAPTAQRAPSEMMVGASRALALARNILEAVDVPRP
jgi:hypothetical protein